MGLFGPDWKTKNTAKTAKAVENVQQFTDPDDLFEIALTAPLEDVRCAAVGRVRDQHMLKAVMLFCTWPWMTKETGCPYKALGGDAVRDTAAEQLKDPEILKEMLLNYPAAFGTQDNIRGAIDRIHDPQMIYEILTGKFPSEPPQKLSDGSKPFSLIRKYALSKLEDPVLLKKLAIGCDGDSSCDWDAMKKLTDPDDLIDVAINTKNKMIKNEIILRTNDPDFLLELLERTNECEYYSSRDLRHSALIKLSDLNKKGDGNRGAFSEEQHEKYIREILNTKDPASSFVLSDFDSWDDLECISLGAVTAKVRAAAFGILCKDRDYPNDRLLRVLTGSPEIKGWISLERFNSDELEQIFFTAKDPEIRKQAKYLLIERLPVYGLHQFCDDSEIDKDVSDAIKGRLDDWNTSAEDLVKAISVPEGSFYFRILCLKSLFYRYDLSKKEGIEEIRDRTAETVLSFIPVAEAMDGYQHYKCEKYLNSFVRTLSDKECGKYGIKFWERTEPDPDNPKWGVSRSMMEYKGIDFELDNWEFYGNYVRLS